MSHQQVNYNLRARIKSQKDEAKIDKGDEVVMNVITEALQAQSSYLSKMIVDQIGIIGKKMDSVNTESMNHFTTLINDLKMEFKAKLEEKDGEIKTLQKEIETLKSEMKKTTINLDDLESMKLRDSVILSGKGLPEVSQREDTISIAVNAIKDHLNMIISSNDIKTAYRIGRKPIEKTIDRRPIAIKLTTEDLKPDLISASKNQKNWGTLFVNENLIVSRRTLLFTLRQLKKNKIISGCGSYNGRIYAYTKATEHGKKDIRHLISTKEDLENFSKDLIKEPLQNFC